MTITAVTTALTPLERLEFLCDPGSVGVIRGWSTP